MDPGLKLDSSNIPKYCPQCQLNGVKSKVKKFRIDPKQSYRVIMCINSKVGFIFQAPAQNFFHIFPCSVPGLLTPTQRRRSGSMTIRTPAPPRVARRGRKKSTKRRRTVSETRCQTIWRRLTALWRVTSANLQTVKS